MRTVYFDNAATTPLRPEVVDVMEASLRNDFGNPSSTHGFGRTAKSVIETARKDIANVLNASPSEIVFTSGGTEADNLILQSAVQNLGIQRIISSKIEHHAVLHTLEHLANAFNTDIVYVNVLPCGSIDLEDLQMHLAASKVPTLVSLMHINNEVGNILPLKEVAEMCKTHNVLFHSDTVQSVGHLPINFSETPLHFATAAAHKFHGPKGVGFAYIRKSTALKPCILGGAQERGMRAGTEAVYAIAGMAEALKHAYTNLEKERAYILSLKHYFKSQIKRVIPEVSFNGSCDDDTKSTYTLLSVCFPLPPEKAFWLLFQMDLNGIACSKGSACQSGSTGGSHVLSEILPPEKRAHPSLRFSFSSFNTREEIDYVISVLENCMSQALKTSL